MTKMTKVFENQRVGILCALILRMRDPCLINWLSGYETVTENRLCVASAQGHTINRITLDMAIDRNSKSQRLKHFHETFDGRSALVNLDKNTGICGQDVEQSLENSKFCPLDITLEKEPPNGAQIDELIETVDLDFNAAGTRVVHESH